MAQEGEGAVMETNDPSKVRLSPSNKSSGKDEQVEENVPPTKDSSPKIKARTNSHSLSSAAGILPSLNRKGKHAEPLIHTELNSERASISMPPPPSRPLSKSRTSSTYSQRSSAALEVLKEDINLGETNHQDFAVEEAESLKTNSTMADDKKHVPLPLPEPALRPRASVAEMDGKRMSVSSMYSLTSARAGGVISSAASATGSENGGSTRATTASVSSGKGPGVSQAETSNISITTSSGGPGAPNGHQLTAREPPAQAAELAKRNSVARGEAQPRPQPPQRSRSRARRRFSGSTGASSHSPSSERGLHLKREDENKPAPWGVIGVCALDVKARSKPSRNILNRLISKGEFEVIVFGDKVILDEEVENWPICDFLISFYSDGFPLDKAIAYVQARKPFCVNDVPMQKILWDRRICLRILDKINVPTPTRLEVNRDGGPAVFTPEMAKHLKDATGLTLEGPEDGTGGQMVAPKKVELIDNGDTLSVDGVLLAKPFVEKPVSGEDHNVCIYYPQSQGGGGRKLFRKIGNKSSEHVEDLTIPRAISEPGSSYLYEKFMRVDNAEDVKAYTVGPTFCHAETRKSPVVDGLVRRNTHGKEIRYITALTKEESAMASRIANSFGQRVCGFDLLRAQGKSYVIDVNGWSFVKDNEEYYEQCARILKDMFVREKQKKTGQSQPSSGVTSPVEGAMSPRKESGFKDNHRSAIQNILSKSPSMSNMLHGHHPNHESNRLSGSISPQFGTSVVPTPKTSPPLVADQDASTIPSADLLPPPEVSIPSEAPSVVSTVPHTPTPTCGQDQHSLPPPAPKHTWKLKGIVSVIRHADRTPKQKYKYTFHTKPFIDLLKGHQEEVLLIGEAALDSVMLAVDAAVHEGVEDQEKLKSLRNVLVKKGGWAGTKVQIKPMFRKRKPEECLNSEMPPPAPEDLAGVNASVEHPSTKSPGKPKNVANLERKPLTRNDSLSGVTLSRITAAEESLVLDKLQLIVKWGGEPTHSARYQAQELGENMRNDLQLLNKDILDEVHVFSSSERRVTTSAQIWASGFTDQKDLASDFITIRKDLLDDSNAAKDEMDKVKKKLKTLLRQGNEAPPEFAWPADMPEPSIVQKYVVHLMKFHRRVMRNNYNKLYGGAATSLNAIVNPGDKDSKGASSAMGSAMSQANATSSIQARWCCGEDAELFRERWEKLFNEFSDAEKVDPSKISELYDTMKFDALHNRQFLEWVFTPSKSILEEEEVELAWEKDRSKNSENAKDETVPTEKAETNKTLHRRIFRRKSVLNGKQSEEESTKAKTDVRLEKLRELYKLSKVLFDFICPQEYGIADSEKLEIGLLTSLPLLKEIVQDLEEMQASDDAKAFVYFTKESHIYTLLNCILEGGIETKIKRSAIPELDYLSQICFELYESENKTPLDAQDVAKYAYSIRITISPGAHTFDPLDVQLDSKHCIGCAPRRSLTAHADWKYVIDTLRAKFHQVKLPKSFLAVNLSESHTFHKKEELEHAEGDATMAEVLNSESLIGDGNGQEKIDVEDVASAVNQEIADPSPALAGDGLDVGNNADPDSVEKSHGGPV
ncbi:inositol hexakisphosphate and diphosphoinositol-pentakisphosphate kinase [Ciborinia camelliae]|nr:inositol hexakisphosphate and diphosphoinositol-pentakisphosphate kinase [Ciborinia camelliae]